MSSTPAPPSNTPTPPPASAQPPIALAELTERCMGNAAIATLILGKFEQQARNDLGAIEQHALARDAAAVARIAHALKGAAGAVAAVVLHDLAAEIETQARKDQLDAVARELAELRAEVTRCLDHLPAARAALGAAASPPAAGTETVQ